MASKEALEALDPARYALSGKAREDALGTLSDLEYKVTQQGEDEAPYTGEYLDT